MKYTNKFIEVVYLSPNSQRVISLKVPEDATIESAIVQSGILTEFPEIDLNINIPAKFQGDGKARGKSSRGAYMQYVSSEMSAQHSQNLKGGGYKVGIFGCVLPLSHPLLEGDRIEIYRPLLIDPKKARRLRAVK